MTTILAKLAADFDADYPESSSWYIALLLDSRDVDTYSVNTSTDVLTLGTLTPNWLTDTRLQVSSTGSNPSPLAASTNYYARDVSGSTLKLAASAGGAAIDITTAGSGVLTITDVAHDETISSVAEWVRKEISSYQELTNRITATMPSSPTTDTVNKRVSKTLTEVIDFTAGTVDISFNLAILIKDGSATPGDTSGEITDFFRFSSTQLIQAGSTYTLNIPLRLGT